LSEDKYNTNEYYKLYQMYISMLTVLFDKELFVVSRIKINKNRFCYNEINNELFKKHINLINKCTTKKLFNVEFIN